MDHPLLQSTVDQELDMAVGSQEDDRPLQLSRRLPTVVEQGKGSDAVLTVGKKGRRRHRRGKLGAQMAGRATPFIGPRWQAGVRSGRDSIDGEWIILISSISKRGKDGAVPSFGRGRWCVRWHLVCCALGQPETCARGSRLSTALECNLLRWLDVGEGWLGRVALLARCVLDPDVACADWVLMWWWHGPHGGQEGVAEAGRGE
jgi:hypothetical protein